MHRRLARSLGALLVASLVAGAAEAALIRGPYLQLGTPTSIVVRWRTDVAEDSRVRWGTIQGALSDTMDDATAVTDHEMTITGLTPDTTYFYEVGSTTTALAGDDTDHVFNSAPATGDSTPIRIWAIGDSGYPDPVGVVRDGDGVRDAYTTFNGGAATADVFLLLGDNAYFAGTDAEYQTDLFEQYPGFMRTTPAWACLGNHEKFAAGTDTILQTGPYYDVFTLPSAGEAGGVPSGTESYYSFDHGNIHFVVLDSEDSISDPTAREVMQDWLEADLASTEAEWLIAFWHRPPYSRGAFHNSDVEQNEVDMRVFMNPIIEDFGVDIVMSGHSHHYERSYMIDGHYGLSGTFGPEHIVDGGLGDPMIDNAYEKSGLGAESHSGTVYVVAGSASEVRSGLGTHPALPVALESLGSFILDVDGDSATGTFLDNLGAVLDTFDMNKAVSCPATPAVGCTAAGKSKLVIVDKDKNKADKLIWKANKMNVDPAEIGDQLLADTIDICAYDASGRLFATALPAGTAGQWTATGSGVKYKDKSASVGGVKVAKIKTSTDGKGLLLAKAKGVHLFTPTIPVSLPVTVQAQNDLTGSCWESVFTALDVSKNADGKFLAKN